MEPSIPDNIPPRAALPTAWSAVEFLETGDKYFDSLLSEFKKAQKSILIEYYIFLLDSVGRNILTAICECRAKGLKVFLRLDGLGSSSDLDAIAEICKAGGIELEVFHPLPFEAPGSYFPVGFGKSDTLFGRWKLINRRTHRKIVIIDEKVAFTGGMNISQDHSVRFSGVKAWHDLSLRLEGPAVSELIHAFWFRPIRSLSFHACLLNYSARLRRERNRWIRRSIRQAKGELWIVTPYFAPTPKMLYQLRMAAKRGVDIRLVLANKSDVQFSRLAALGMYRKLLKWGITVCEYEPTILHRKLWVIDELALVGSTNLNHRSFIHDLELDVILRENSQVAEARKLFLVDQKNSRAITIEFLNNRPFYARALSTIAGWFTYWL